MLNYEQAINAIHAIKEEMHIDESSAKKTKSSYAKIYHYLNHAGGRIPTPSNLQSYVKIIKFFQNPEKILHMIRNGHHGDYDNKAIKKEVQTLILLWLQEASTKTPQKINVNALVQQLTPYTSLEKLYLQNMPDKKELH